MTAMARSESLNEKRSAPAVGARRFYVSRCISEMYHPKSEIATYLANTSA